MSPKARRPGTTRPALPTVFAVCTCLVASSATSVATTAPYAWALDGPPPTPATEISLTAQSLGQVSPYVFGSNLLWPYNAEGAFDPATGRFYPSFVDQAEQMGLTALRYPAGITADSFQWQRAIGPQDQRQANETPAPPSRYPPPLAPGRWPTATRPPSPSSTAPARRPTMCRARHLRSSPRSKKTWSGRAISPGPSPLTPSA